MFIAHALLADPSESYSMASLLSSYVSSIALLIDASTVSQAGHGVISARDLINSCLQTFHLVLVPNPDGYVYTWETDRLW